MEYTDNRLPQGITIAGNDFGEFVAAKRNPRYNNRLEVASMGDWNVKAGRSVNEAVQHYLNGSIATK